MDSFFVSITFIACCLLCIWVICIENQFNEYRKKMNYEITVLYERIEKLEESEEKRKQKEKKIENTISDKQKWLCEMDEEYMDMFKMW